MKQQNAILQKLDSVHELMKAEATTKPLNTTEAAAYLSISKSTLFKYSCARKIPKFTTGKLIYFKKSDLDDFIFRIRKHSDYEQEAQANGFVAKRNAGTR